MNAISSRMLAALRYFRTARGGNIAVTFALAMVPLAGAVGAAVDYGKANAVRTAMQAALDSTALALVKTAGSSSNAALTTSAAAIFNANFVRPGVKNIQVAAQYDQTSRILSVSGSGALPATFTGMLGITNINLSGLSKATQAGQLWPVCVLIAATNQNHTLFTSGATAHITFDNCMVQVNTQNLDAVEARNTSYIHSTNGENCFVGDIHYGDVLPPKDPSCTFFADPFAGLAMPASAATCNNTNLSVIGTVTLQPGTYCGNTTVNGTNITFAPGLYIIKDGNITITGSSKVTANGVTFVLTGKGPNFYINKTAQFTQTAMTSGPFAGFAFYLDTSATTSCSFSDGGKLAGQKLPNDCINAVDDSAIATITGIVYLANSAFLADTSANVTVTGSFISWALVANSAASIAITGAFPSASSAAAAMQKFSQNGNGKVRLVN